MSTPHEDRIRERAFAIWDSAGRPAGRDLEYWLKAERELRAEDSKKMSSPDSIVQAPEPPRSESVPPAKATRKSTAAGKPAKAPKAPALQGVAAGESKSSGSPSARKKKGA